MCAIRRMRRRSEAWVLQKLPVVLCLLVRLIPTMSDDSACASSSSACTSSSTAIVPFTPLLLGPLLKREQRYRFAGLAPSEVVLQQRFAWSPVHLRVVALKLGQES